MKNLIAVIGTAAFVWLFLVPWLGLATAFVTILLLAYERPIRLTYWRRRVLRTQAIADSYASTKGKWSIGVQRMYDKDVDYALSRYHSI